MKKLLAFAAIAAIAATTQATNVKWGLNEGQSLSNLGLANGTMYLIQGSIPGATTFDGKGSFSASDLGGTIVSSGSLDNGFYYKEEGISSVGSSTGRLPFYVAAFSTDGKIVAVATATKTVNIKDSDLSGTALYNAANFNKYEVVPEPTTVALLALGLAAVGLKRKVA